MTKEELRAIHNAHLTYLLNNSPVDYIIEDRGMDTFKGPCSEFVTSAGGDVTVYRVMGYGPEFKIYIH